MSLFSPPRPEAVRLRIVDAEAPHPRNHDPVGALVIPLSPLPFFTIYQTEDPLVVQFFFGGGVGPNCYVLAEDVVRLYDAIGV
jgi:hypothetical protein